VYVEPSLHPWDEADFVMVNDFSDMFYQWVAAEIREEIKSFLEVNENENTTYQNLWDTAKAVLRGKFIAMSTYIKRTEKSQINNLMLHFKLIEKQEQAKPKTSKRGEIIKIKAKINEIETKKIQRINETKSWFFEKICKIDKPLANLRREKTQISRTRNENGVIKTNTKEIQGIIREYSENLNSNKFENLEEIVKFLDTYDHPKLNQEDINHLNRSIILNEIEGIKISHKKEKSSA
jgi:hypothetical protein